ncbi:MAG: helix-turn-helix transcriptional regulator [Patescibacteria group bacterium]|nr:helix-turn-helix transcriptional regulator [Patescibacteria group bacterium]
MYELELVDCPCMGGTLDRLIQPAILLVVQEGSLHGYRIAERIAEIPGFAGQKPDVSGVYRFLKSMERKGLLTASWEVSESGPARKCYEITSNGQQCLAEWIKTLEEYRKSIAALLRAARRTMR